MHTTNTIISKSHGYSVGDEVFTRGKKVMNGGLLC